MSKLWMRENHHEESIYSFPGSLPPSLCRDCGVCGRFRSPGRIVDGATFADLGKMYCTQNTITIIEHLGKIEVVSLEFTVPAEFLFFFAETTNNTIDGEIWSYLLFCIDEEIAREHWVELFSWTSFYPF